MRPSCKRYSRFLFRCLLLFGFTLCIHFIRKMDLNYETCDLLIVERDHIKKAHNFGRDVVEAPCRQAHARTEMGRLFPDKYNLKLPSFVEKDKYHNDSVYEFGPPFGFREYFKELEDLLNLMSEYALPEDLENTPCKRCIVLGSGGVLHGLGLGDIVNKFDVVIRLNNAPMYGYEKDVGNKTTIRITYPEGAPASEQEYFTNSLFVTVLFKHADFLWLQAMLKNETLSVWNKLFFWKSVNENLPLKSHQFRILNPLIVKETALDILQLVTPRQRLWGWDKNVPTIGTLAVVLATHLCDEVSLAGFGYDLQYPDRPLHYYDNLCMNAMDRQTMHDLNKERKLLQMLVKTGVIKDLSGGLHCEFCPSNQT